MDNRPIGFFDSGLGGLTCMPSLMKALPNERIIYFGDTARTPYGSKAISTIKNFSIQISDFLIHNDVKMIAIACNTVSAIALDDIRKKNPNVPVLGIISPASHTVANTCKPEDNIGIIGTKVTITSEAYKQKILKFNPKLRIFQKACPVFVPLIEEGIVDNDIMDLSIKYYLDDFIEENNIDVLVLGCTHYPLIKKNITRLYPDLRIINPSEEILHSITEKMDKCNLFADENDNINTFIASDLSENFVKMIQKIFANSDAKVNFKSFNLDELEKGAR